MRYRMIKASGDPTCRLDVGDFIDVDFHFPSDEYINNIRGGHFNKKTFNEHFEIASISRAEWERNRSHRQNDILQKCRKLLNDATQLINIHDDDVEWFERHRKLREELDETIIVNPGFE